MFWNHLQQLVYAVNYLTFIILLFSICENVFLNSTHYGYWKLRLYSDFACNPYKIIPINSRLPVCFIVSYTIYIYMGIFKFIFRLSPRHITDSGSCWIILQSLCSEWSILPIALDYGNGWPYQQVKRLWRWRRGLWHTAWYHKETRGPLLLYLNVISLPLSIDLLLSVWPEDFLTVLCRNLPALTCLHNDNACN